MLKKGLSTHIFVYNILNETIVRQIKAAGFDAIEIWGMAPHFNYKNNDEIEKLAQLLKDNEIKVVSFHGPIYEEVSPPKERRWLSLASTDVNIRQKAIDETKQGDRLHGFIWRRAFDCAWDGRKKRDRIKEGIS